MNRDETIEAIAVMQAWVDGKKIQGKYQDAAWQDFEPYHLSNWSWGDWQFRIKPEPRVMYFNDYGGGVLGGNYASYEEAYKQSTQSPVKIVKFIEVLD